MTSKQDVQNQIKDLENRINTTTDTQKSEISKHNEIT